MNSSSLVMGKSSQFSEQAMEELLHKYAPILLLYKAEVFMPLPVECFFDVAVIAQGKKIRTIERDIRLQFINTKYQDKLIINPKLLQTDSEGVAHKNFLLKHQSEWLNSNKSKLAAYGYWVQTKDERFLYLTLTYYFFYLGNIRKPYRMVNSGFKLTNIVGLTRFHDYSHDCDWEMIRIFFKLEISKPKTKFIESKIFEKVKPDSILFQQHTHDPISMDLMIKWSSMIKNDSIFGTHPKILVGNGTHASAPMFKPSKDDLDITFQGLITQKSISKRLENFLIHFINEYPHKKSELAFQILPPKLKLKVTVPLKKTNYELISINKKGNSQSWINFQGNWGNRWEKISGDGVRGPKFFSGFERTFRFTKNPTLQSREPEYWITLGTINIEKKKLDEAKSCFTTVLGLLAKNNDKPQNQLALATTKLCLGGLEQMLGNRKQAKLCYTASLAIFQDLGDKTGEACSLVQLGINAENEGQRQDARSYFEASIKIFKDLNNKAGEGGLLHNLGILGQIEGQRQDARNYFKASLAIKLDLDDKFGVARVMHSLGILAKAEDCMQEARDYYMASLAIDKDLGNKIGTAKTLHQLGILNQAEGCLQEARNNYEVSLAIFQESDAKAGEASSLHQLGTLNHAEGWIKVAKNNYKDGLTIFRDLGDKTGEASSLHQLGVLAQAEGRIQDALNNHKASLAIARNLGDKSREASSLHQLAMLAQREGRMQEAVKNYKACLAIFQALGDKVREAWSLASLGEIKQNDGEHIKARIYYKQSLAIFEEVNDSRGIKMLTSILQLL